MIEVGTRVFDKYEILRRLAVGGMGEIFLARQTGFVERLVILKSLLPDLAEHQDQLDQFLDEARVCANLNHPNVIAIFDVGQWDNVYFIAMEYIAGEDLSHLLKAARSAKEAIPLEVSAGIIRDAAQGLDHAHQASDSQGRPLGIVHRDISPQNIMVRTDGVVKVVDFGIARAANREVKTAAGVIKGKYRYMSPEQALDKPLDGRSDQFALGVVLWELVTGKRLFQGESPVQILTDVVRRPTPPPSTVIPDFPPALEGVILKMTAKEPDERYARCGEVAAALRGWLETVPKASRAEVGPFVQKMLGEKIAEKVKALSSPEAARGEVICQQCGKANIAGNRFCGKCGAVLGSVSGPSGPGTSRSTSGSGRSPVSGSGSMSPGTGRRSSPGATSTGTARAGPGTGTLSPPGTSPGTGPGSHGGDTRPGTTRSAPSVLSASLSEAATAQITGAMKDLSSLMAGEKRTATVLSASLTGLTDLRKTLDAEAQHEVLSGLLDELSEMVERYEGSVHQLDPDRMAFIFGVPTAHADDSARAIACALAMREAATACGKRHKTTLGLKAGVDVGSLLVSGTRRGSSRLTGAPLVGSQKLEESAPAGLVLASAAVQLLTRASVSFGTKEFIVRRGDDEALHAAQVEGLREAELSGKVEGGLVGRAKEVETLDRALAKACSGTLAGVLIAGEAGVGKSRLLREALELAQRHKMLIARARAERAAAAELGLAVRLLRSLCQALSASRPGSRNDANALVFAGLGTQVIGPLNAILENKPRSATPEARMAEDADLATAFAAAARLTPLCLAVDDLHLADDRSIAVLADALRRAEGTRCALVATSSVQGAVALSLPSVEVLELGPLSAADAVAVASQQVGGVLPERAAAIVRERALGNPYYAKQIAQLLADKGAIQRLGEAWQISPAIEQLAIPATLQHAVEAQLDRLTPACQTTLRLAAAAGASFSRDLLIGALGVEFPLGGALNEALDRGVLLHVEGAADTFRFAQVMLQDLLLNKALRADLKQLHLRLAQAIEAGAPPPEGDRERALADRYLAADIPDRAIYWAARAATLLQERGLLVAAATYHRAALNAALGPLTRPPITERNASWLLNQLALALPCLARVSQDDALAQADTIFAKLHPGLAPAERAEALRQKALLLVQASRVPEAEKAIEEALTLTAPLNDAEVRATLLGDLGAALEARGDLEGAAQKLTESFKTVGARPTRNQDFYWEHLNRLGRVYARLQNLAKAREFFDLAREQARRVSSVSGEAKAIVNIAGVIASEGQVPDALVLLDLALELAQRVGDRVEQARIHYNAGRLLMGNHQDAEARERLQKAAAAAREVGWREGLALASQALDSVQAA